MDDKSSDADERPPQKDQEQAPTFVQRVKRLIFGRPRDLSDSRLVHHISVVAFLAWIGLGADGLSSSAYGPEEAFRTLGAHTYLAIPLALLTMTTVFVISYAYSRIIEQFPHGGGGYVVATAILGPRVGVVSGAALLVDYVLTITVSIAASGDALFSMLPPIWHGLKLPTEVVLIVGLTMINIRGLKESILILMPVFLLFLATHVVLIGGGILGHGAELPKLASDLHGDFRAGLSTLGMGGMLLLFMHAYSMGGGTYTGIEAVSNGLSIMREPRVHTARRTMVYMAISLALTAGGLILCYLLSKVQFEPGKTMNAVLSARVAENLSLGQVFVVLTLVSEGALLVVAAQAGFVDGPRVLANMAIDSWAPRRFASLSERLTTRNGIVLMGGAGLAALLYTHGDVRHIVVMYSINVFLTFSLTELSMYVLGRQSQKTRRLEKENFDPRCRPRDVPDHPRRDGLREVPRRRVDHSYGDERGFIAVFLRSPPLRLRCATAQTPGPRTRARGARDPGRHSASGPRSPDGGDPRRRLQRHGHSHGDEHPAHLSGNVQELRVPFRRSRGLGGFSRRVRGRCRARAAGGGGREIRRLGELAGGARDVSLCDRDGCRGRSRQGLPGRGRRVFASDVFCGKDRI